MLEVNNRYPQNRSPDILVIGLGNVKITYANQRRQRYRLEVSVMNCNLDVSVE
jgi:hypothetical protein